MNTFVVDIGGTHIKFGLMAHGVPRILTRHFPASALHHEAPVDALADLIHQACQFLGITANTLDAVVATVPGFLEPDLDRVHVASNIPQLNGRRLATELSARLHLPVYLERDVILLLQGEWQAGAGRGAQHLLGVFFGTGVGAAWLDHGRPFRGSGFALEIGHIPFRGSAHSGHGDGEPPPRLEQAVSGRTLEAIAKRHSTDISGIFLAAANHPGIRQEIDHFICDMAVATATAITLFSPQRLVVGGGICHMAGFPYDLFAQQVMALTPQAYSKTTLDLRRAELGWQAALHGATVRLAHPTTLQHHPPGGHPT